MATHSSILAERPPWTEQAGGYSPWSCKVRQLKRLSTHAHKEDPRFHFPLFPQISRQIPNALLVFYLRFLRDSLGFPGSLVGTESIC